MTHTDLIERLRRMSPSLDILSCEDVLQAADALEAERAENQRLREALRPFGDAADHAIETIGKTTTLGVLGALAPYFVTLQDFNRARAALAGEVK